LLLLDDVSDPSLEGDQAGRPVIWGLKKVRRSAGV
jgi:hypothetical protein